jgi:hypothetical protein
MDEKDPNDFEIMPWFFSLISQFPDKQIRKDWCGLERA